MGDTPTDLLPTLSFEFPAHGHNFANGSVFVNGRGEQRRLCRHPKCPTCLVLPQTFIFHIDCLHLLRLTIKEQTKYQRHEVTTQYSIQDTLWQIWLAGHWSRPWAKLYYTAPPLYVSINLLTKTTLFDTEPSSVDMEFVSLVRKLQLLPEELLQIIAAWSSESTLWRFVVVLNWPFSIYGNLRNSKVIALSPNALSGWSRGQCHSYYIQDKHNRKFVRFILDGDGTKTVEFVDRRTTVTSNRGPVHGIWYIFEESARLQDFLIQTQVYF